MIVIIIVSALCSVLCGLYLNKPRNGESSEILEKILYISEDKDVNSESKTKESENEVLEELDDSPVSDSKPNYAEDAEDILREINNG